MALRDSVTRRIRLCSPRPALELLSEDLPLGEAGVRTTFARSVVPRVRKVAPGGIRTPNPRIRSPMLCPVELRAHQVFFVNQPYHDRAICGEYPQTTRDPFC